MKLIIAGSRHFILSPDYIDLMIKFHGISGIKEIVSGNAEGADWAGEQYSIEHLNKEAKTFPADWAGLGAAAGPARNKKMAEYADACLLIWDGKSPGSADMKAHMLRMKKPLYEVIIKDPINVG